MAAYVMWRGSLCEGCGIDADLGRDPHTTFSLTDEICWGCRIKEDKAAEMMKEADKVGVTGGHHGVKVYISGARRNPNPREAVADG